MLTNNDVQISIVPMETKYPPTNDEVRERIAEHMVLNQMTLHALSLESRVSPSTLREFMSGKQGMALAPLERIAPIIYGQNRTK